MSTGWGLEAFSGFPVECDEKPKAADLGRSG